MEELDIDCPYCGENIGILVDTSISEQEYYEDCSVCCCPILFKNSLDDFQNLKIIAKRDDD